MKRKIQSNHPAKCLNRKKVDYIYTIDAVKEKISPAFFHVIVLNACATECPKTITASHFLHIINNRNRTVCCTVTGHPTIIVEGDTVQCKLLPLNPTPKGSQSEMGISEYMDSYSRLAAAILTNAQYPPSKRFLNYRRIVMPGSQYTSNEPYFDSEKLYEVLEAQKQAPEAIQHPQLWGQTAQPDVPNEKTVCVEVYEK